MMDQMIIKANKDNDLKFRETLSDDEKKKKEKDQQDGLYTESVDDGPLEYFTE